MRWANYRDDCLHTNGHLQAKTRSLLSTRTLETLATVLSRAVEVRCVGLNLERTNTCMEGIFDIQEAPLAFNGCSRNGDVHRP